MALISPMQGFKRLAHDFQSRGRSLGQLWRRRSIWQVRIRWAVPPAILLCLWVGHALGYAFNWLPLVIVAGAILAYNATLALVFATVRPARDRREAADVLVATVQVSLDYAALLALLHFTGGLASPLLFFLAFHVIFAAILFRPSVAYLFAAGASLATAGLGVLEVSGVVAVHAISYEGRTFTLVDRPGHALVTLLFFSAAMFITAGVSNMILGRLRERVLALAEATERAASLNDKLSSLYVMVEAISVEKVLDRVLTTVVQELTKVTEVAGISVKLLSDDGKSLSYAAVNGLPHEFGQGRVIELDRSPFNRRVVEGETVILGQIREHRSFQLREELLAAGIESVMLAPLTVQDRVLGVLGAYRQEADQFSEEDLSFFRLAADLVAIAIDDARQAEAIEELMAERTRLMLQVAHNLRAPLSATGTMLDTLGAEYLGPINAKQAEYVERMGRRLKAMQQTIGELLTLAHARSVDPTASRAPVDLAGLAREVTEVFRAAADEKGVQLVLEVREELPGLSGSTELLRQLLENLVSNGLKYTPEGGAVTVSVGPANDGDLEIAVVDTGIGIPADEQPKLFTEFFRASNVRALKEVGTGLGLAIVKQIAERHGGEVHVESEVGHGTRVVVHLPTSGES